MKHDRVHHRGLEYLHDHHSDGACDVLVYGKPVARRTHRSESVSSTTGVQWVDEERQQQQKLRGKMSMNRNTKYSGL